ncbi:MAG TPA: penicillin-binding transpeptidase domain-containing protein [Anaerolineales bacterium]|nr:penicillin-binding transpeptidase domain-containing protein [Anaerolineales bacterium]
MLSQRLSRGLSVVLCAALVACAPGVTPTAAPLAPTPIPTAGTPDARGTVQAFLDAWGAFNYVGMFSLLSPLSQDATSAGAFEQRYSQALRTATVRAVKGLILSELRTGSDASVLVEITWDTIVFGTISRRVEVPLVFADGLWRIAWTDGLILPELAGGGTLLFDGDFPSRGNIYDRNGRGIAVRGDAIAIGVQPGLIVDRLKVVTTLAGLLSIRPAEIEARLNAARPDWYVPIGEAAAADVQPKLAELQSLAGVIISPYNTRLYPDGGIAPQVVGYLGPITPEGLVDYQARGYTGDERVGQSGLEAWGEQLLAGQRGGRLVAVRGDGTQVVVAESQRRPAQSITTTLDRDLQLAAQEALTGFRGSIVVLDPETGAVLAMASSPGFDPNLFDPTNRNAVGQADVLTDPANPLLNRATQGAYPPGSVFKIAVAGSGLNSGAITADTIINCGNTWSGLGPNAVKYNWTFDRGLAAPGPINVVQALAFSCNPFFYQLALDMDAVDPTTLPELIRGFGFGEPTGIGQVPESGGLIPDPDWKQQTYNDPWRPGDAVNMGIGQGYVLVTPLQIARMIAAVANGGTLYRPQLVLRVAPPDGPATLELEPEAQGRLPLTNEQLATITAGLDWVAREKGGTARHRFLDLNIPVSGKTGTAEDPAGPAPHGWFAGYTEADRPDRPDFAAVVMIENVGDGSEYAAPIFRRLVEIYFNGKATALLPWETELETPQVEATPTPSSSVGCRMGGVRSQASGVSCDGSSVSVSHSAIRNPQSAVSYD